MGWTGPIRRLVFAWLALLLLLTATITGAYLPLGPYNTVLALAIATTKASIVAVIFMKVLRGGPPLTIVFAAAGFFWLLILLGLAGADYVTRPWYPLG